MPGSRSCAARKWRKPGDLVRLPTAHGVPEIPVLLKPKPEIRGHSHDPGEAEGRIRCHTSLPAGNLVEPRERDSEPGRKGGLGNPQGLQKLFEQHLTRVRGGLCRGRRRVTSRPLRTLPRPRPRALMLVCDLDVIGIAGLPTKTNAVGSIAFHAGTST